jgi:hypothetical protein
MDNRTKIEKILWNVIGEPLYYCEECLKSVQVINTNGVVTVKRNCEHTGNIMAPRKSILSGKGHSGLSTVNKVKSKYSQVASKITGRNV